MSKKINFPKDPEIAWECKKPKNRRWFSQTVYYIYRFFRQKKSWIKTAFIYKPNMESWADREVKLACKQERVGDKTSEGDWDYGCACYESALKIYKMLLKEGHSGVSITLTKYVLNKLIDGKPLTPINDIPDIWEDVSDTNAPKKELMRFQCKRLSSLFKYVYNDGRVVYRDIDSHYCIDINTKTIHSSGLVQKIIDELFPITMPYMPGNPIKVYSEDILTDRKNGDFDTVAIFYAIKSNGEKIEINRFFKDSELDWDEINKEEYNWRKNLELDRIRSEEDI